MCLVITKRSRQKPKPHGLPGKKLAHPAQGSASCWGKKNKAQRTPEGKPQMGHWGVVHPGPKVGLASKRVFLRCFTTGLLWLATKRPQTATLAARGSSSPRPTFPFKGSFNGNVVMRLGKLKDFSISEPKFGWFTLGHFVSFPAYQISKKTVFTPPKL